MKNISNYGLIRGAIIVFLLDGNMKKIALAMALVCLFVSSAYAALQFDGVDDYLAVPDSDNWNFGNSNFTIDCWANFASTTTQQIVGQGSPYNNWAFYISSDRLWFISFDGDKIIEATASFTPAINTWYHLAVARKGDAAAGDWLMFVDGVSLNVTADPYDGDIPDFGEYLYVGNSFSGDRLKGYMDEMRIWDYAMTQSDVNYWKQYSASGEESDLLGCWHFDEGSGGTAYDSSPYGNNGQLIGATWSASGAPIQPVIPEPATMVLFGLGGIATALIKRRKR